MTWAMIGLALTGLAISIHLTTDSRWVNWHLSRLGEGEHLSSAIFNFTMGTAALALTLIASRLTEEIELSDPHKGARILRNLIIVAAVCWVGVACFPFDRFPVIHNGFGYGEAFILMFTMLALPRICPRFSRRTYLLGGWSAVIVFMLMVFFLATHAITLLFVELLGQVTLFAWLLSMAYDMRKIRRKPIATLYK